MYQPTQAEEQKKQHTQGVRKRHVVHPPSVVIESGTVPSFKHKRLLHETLENKKEKFSFSCGEQEFDTNDFLELECTEET